MATSKTCLLIKGSGLPPNQTHRKLEASAIHGVLSFVFCDAEQHLCAVLEVFLWVVQDYFRLK